MNRAHAGAGADARGLALDALAFNRLRHGAAHRVGAAVDCHLVEAHRHPRGAVGASGGLDGRDDAAHHRAGRNRGPAVDVQIDERRPLEPILDLRRA